MAERRRIIAEALARVPPGPGACPLRSLAIADRVVRLRVPPPDYLRHFHIREAHALAVCREPSASGVEYHALLQAEFSRLQDAQAWYWDQLWPGGLALARAVLEAPELVRQQRVLELGTGLGVLASCVALAGAASVLASDVEPKALAFAAHNAAENGVASTVQTTSAWDWHDPLPQAVVSHGRFDVVLLPDVLYDLDAVERLAELAPTLVRPGGRLIVADGTDRPYGDEHCSRLLGLLVGPAASLAASGPSQREFEITGRQALHAGASADDGGSAPSRPVQIIHLQRRRARPIDASQVKASQVEPTSSTLTFGEVQREGTPAAAGSFSAACALLHAAADADAHRSNNAPSVSTAPSAPSAPSAFSSSLASAAVASGLGQLGGLESICSPPCSLLRLSKESNGRSEWHFAASVPSAPPPPWP